VSETEGQGPAGARSVATMYPDQAAAALRAALREQGIVIRETDSAQLRAGLRDFEQRLSGR